MPKIRPKKEPKVSTKDKIPIWLNNGIQKIPIGKAINAIITPVLFSVRLFGKKFNNEFCEGT